MCSECNQSFDIWLDICVELTAYAASTRYPDNVEITEEDTYFALDATDKIYDFCVSLISELQPVEQEQGQNNKSAQDQGKEHELTQPLEQTE